MHLCPPIFSLQCTCKFHVLSAFHQSPLTSFSPHSLLWAWPLWSKLCLPLRHLWSHVDNSKCVNLPLELVDRGCLSSYHVDYLLPCPYVLVGVPTSPINLYLASTPSQINLSIARFRWMHDSVSWTWSLWKAQYLIYLESPLSKGPSVEDWCVLLTYYKKKLWLR